MGPDFVLESYKNSKRNLQKFAVFCRVRNVVSKDDETFTHIGDFEDDDKNLLIADHYVMILSFRKPYVIRWDGRHRLIMLILWHAYLVHSSINRKSIYSQRFSLFILYSYNIIIIINHQDIHHPRRPSILRCLVVSKQGGGMQLVRDS